MPVNYSVLMSVYYKEHPDYLRQSMQSIYDQTVPTDDFILVCDGPLTQELDAVIADMQQQFGSRLHICQLLRNGGLGKALNFGIGQCKNELIARMDSDDVSYPNRCERQLLVFQKHPEFSIVGGIVEEFSDTIQHITARRNVPEKQSEILRFAKRRNPFNHPSVMYRKSVVEQLGGYWTHKVEDYNLWVRLLQHGFIGYNLQEPLVWMRAGKDMYKRRGNWNDFLSQKQLFQYMQKSHFISTQEYYFQLLVRICAVATPNFMRAFLFKNLLRRKS